MSARVVENIVELIGSTPLVRLRKVTAGLKPKVYAKLELLNPGGSVKDRIGLAMIIDAEKKGLLKPGFTIVEPTSGNTGMGLALAAILRGYNIIFTVPDKMSKDKIDLLRAVGAKVRVTPSKVPPGHPANYVEVAKKIARDTPHSFMPNQYQNLANPAAHYASTGPEIWKQTKGLIDALVAGVGTGGTISGTGRYLKERNPRVKVIGVDPEGSILASRFAGKKTAARPYKVEGIGEDFLPSTLDMGVIDEFVTVSDEDALTMTRRLAMEEGILAGTSSGAAVRGALEVARNLDSSKVVVVILPDTGRSYLNKVYNDDWMMEQGFIEAKHRKISVRELMAAKPRELKGIRSIKPSDNLEKALILMATEGLSNLPVMEHGVQVGNLSEKMMLKRASVRGSSVKVEDAMEAPLPTIDIDGEVAVPGPIIGDRGALIVLEGNVPIGILTTTDVINHFAKG